MVNRPADELYAAWRDFERLPQFMDHLESVRVIGPRQSHWVAQGPGQTRIEWDAEIIEDRPSECIAWQSLPGAMVEHSGCVRFEPGPAHRGTVVRVTMDYRPPGGRLGRFVARLFNRAPEQQVTANLHRFEQLMETGHITTIEGQPAARPTGHSRLFDHLIPA